MEGITPGWRFISVKQDFSLISAQVGILHKIFVSLYEGFFSLTYQADWSFQPDFPWILIINLIVYIVLPLIGAGSVPFQTQIKISNWIKNASKKKQWKLWNMQTEYHISSYLWLFGKKQWQKCFKFHINNIVLTLK